MRFQLTKRACDECITRKVKCSGAWPCDTCRNAPKQVRCTYLKPVRRRGPKVKRLSSQMRSGNTHVEKNVSATGEDKQSDVRSRPGTIPHSILEPVVCLYQHSSYSVWPVINAEKLVQKLSNQVRCGVNTYGLATALCAATMAQLQLAPLTDGEHTVDSSAIATECMRVREESNYRENVNLKSLLVSFFLHVYHAKINKRDAAMMFIQEAIAGARLLKLDGGDARSQTTKDDGVVVNQEILFPLLWISERGYAMHLGLVPSYTSPITLPDIGHLTGDVHAQGLLELAKLFAAFDCVSVRSSVDSDRESEISANCLAETEAALSLLSLDGECRASTRMADCCITKEWMRTIIWQEALSQHMLSSTSYVELLTFNFPVLVSRDLLSSLQVFTESDLLPLGRDQVNYLVQSKLIGVIMSMQLLKCFEVTNSLADVVLYIPSVPTNIQFGPQDFLHALYQKLLPFLEQDSMLKSILHAKTAEALVTSPARLLTSDEDTSANHDASRYAMTGVQASDISKQRPIE
ncbi:hypothetical protein BDV25DRAFT_125246 [Aspergillus avenaceus]|uniref:Zn(2)-C6 fungal-type domain-containing protein n=1 Tax=Aspergillus avenaceus TaxID=36643 RepID=A0A5N6TT95_ASPAV|nr:hypothetical protein BDV25DRAFT_125246 [Aspergillus avenaceus]